MLGEAREAAEKLDDDAVRQIVIGELRRLAETLTKG